MKKIMMMLLCLMIIGCTQKIETKDISNIENSRIQIVEFIIINGVSYKIIKVDSSEYLIINNKAISKL